jgi:hypothetical protein
LRKSCGVARRPLTRRCRKPQTRWS